MNNQTRLNKRKTKKKKKWIWFLSPIAILLIIFAVYGVQLSSKIADITNQAFKPLERGESSSKRTEAVYPGKDNFSVLFIGVDEREKGRGSRSDVLILATFNKEDNTIKMMHIPRDSRVNIPGKKVDKIGHAHAYGGVDLTVATVEELLDVPVDYYVKLNFDAFVEIIDALGGVTVDVPFTFTEQDSHDKKGAITLHEGTQTLNGEEALAFVRMRKQDPRGDFGRGNRQQQVIKAIIEKSAKMSSITKYDDMLDGIGDNLSTNLTFQNIIALHPYAKSIHSIETIELKGKNSTINGKYFYSLDEESVTEVSNIFKDHLGLK